MKLVFNTNNTTGMTLAYVECLSTEEADQFLGWFNSKVNVAGVASAPAEVVVKDEEPASVPAVALPKITKAEVSQAAIALVQTKGRAALEPILARYNAKRISDIRAEDMAAVMDDILGAK